MNTPDQEKLPIHLTAPVQEGDWIYDDALVAERIAYERDQGGMGAVVAIAMKSSVSHEKMMRARAQHEETEKREQVSRAKQIVDQRWRLLKSLWVKEKAVLQPTPQDEADPVEQEDKPDDTEVKGRQFTVPLSNVEMAALEALAAEDMRTLKNYLTHTLRTIARAYIAKHNRRPVGRPKNPVGRPKKNPVVDTNTLPMPDVVTLDINPFDQANWHNLNTLALRMHPGVDPALVGGALNARLKVWISVVDNYAANGG